MIKLYKGDCLIESDKIESGSVDLILTDLPYGTMKGAEKSNIYGSKDKPKHEWDSVIDTEKIMQLANRILRKNGKMILFAQDPFSTELKTKAIPNLPYNYSLIWEKDTFAFALIAKKAPVNYYEDILVFSKKDDPSDGNELRDYFKEQRQLIKNISLIEINRVAFGDTKGKDGMAGNILSSYKKGWSFPTKEKYTKLQESYDICLKPYEELKEINDLHKNSFASTFNLWEGNKYKSNILKYKKDYNGFHPTQKPILLLEDLIRTFSNENDLVVDLTMGSGSTGVACKNLNRNFIGIEMDENYFNIAKERINI